MSEKIENDNISNDLIKKVIVDNVKVLDKLYEYDKTGVLPKDQKDTPNHHDLKKLNNVK